MGLPRPPTEGAMSDFTHKQTVCRALPKIQVTRISAETQPARSNSISAYRNPRSIFDTRHNAGRNKPADTHASGG